MESAPPIRGPFPLRTESVAAEVTPNTELSNQMAMIFKAMKVNKLHSKLKIETSGTLNVSDTTTL